MWNNDKLLRLVKEFKEEIFPFLVEGLLYNSSNHWNPTVQGLTFYVMKILVEIDSNLFDESAAHFY